MSESIVHGRLMVEDLSYSMIQILNRCRFELGLRHRTRQGSGKQSRDCIVMSGSPRIISAYIDTALHRVKAMSPQAQQKWVS